MKVFFGVMFIINAVLGLVYEIADKHDRANTRYIWAAMSLMWFHYL